MADVVSPDAEKAAGFRRSRSSPTALPGPSRTRLGRLGQGFLLFFRVMRANPLTLVGFVLTLLVSVTALLVFGVPALTQLLTGHSVTVLPYPPLDAGAFPINQAPSSAHWLGTDKFGADVFSNVAAALPTDLGIGFSVAGFALIVGSFLGLVAGYWDKPGTASGLLSATILRITDIFLAFPTLVLALAISATLGRGEFQSELAVMATWWPYYVRLTRGEVLAIKSQPYVTAARAAGVPDGRIVYRHILRNLLEPLAVYFTLDVGTVIVTYSTISYIGVGVPQSIPEWGNLLAAYQDLLLTAPWTVWGVAGAIFVTVLAFSLLGDGLRDILDPRSRRILAGTGATPSGGVRAFSDTALPSGEA